MPNNNSQGSGNMDGTPSDIAGHSTNGITIPINHEHGAAPSNHYHNPPHQQHTQYHGQPQQPGHHHTTYMDSFNPMATGSPRSQPQQSGAQDYDMPHIMGNMGFNPHRDIDIGGIFDRGTLGRRLEPFGTYRKRTNKHDPTADPFGRDAFSIFHDDDPDFNFPQFNTIGRRRAHAAANDDFFNRVPPEFAHIIPENFGRRSTGMSSDGGNSGIPPGGNPNSSQQHQYYQPQQHQHQAYQQQNPLPPHYNNIPLSAAELNLKSKELRDAAIQTEDPSAGGGERSEVDNAQHLYTDNLNQHGLRNTVDMGIKSPAEMNELHNSRSHSAPPPEQLQQSQQYHQQQRQNGGPNNTAAAASANVRNTPPPPAHGHSQFATQTTPPASGYPNQQPPYYAKSYYSPHQQQHGQGQPKEQTPPQPQTPGGSYIRTIPIFVEGRSEPIINAHKEIPNQNSGGPGGVSASASANASANYGGGATAAANARAYTPPQQQQQWQQGQQQPQHYSTQQQKSAQHRPTPLNTQHQPSPQTEHEQAAGQHGGASAAASGLPPQTPHTIDSINKIQDIQRDVLDLMGRVEQFTGTRKDKHYVYLDEMLTRNLLKLDTIDTNGKESIRLARKEAIKCIQASINVLEAKAEQNARNASQADSQVGTSGSGTNVNQEQTPAEKSASNQEISVARSESGNKTSSTPIEEKPIDATQIQTPIPLPPPEGMQVPVESPQNTPSSSTTDTQVESSTKNGESK